jgi:hypothetical protein
LAGLGVGTVDGFLDFERPLGAFITAHRTITGIGEPDAAIGVHHDIVWGIEAFALPLIRDYGNGTVVLIPHDTAGKVLARKLTPLVIEGIAVGIVRRIPHRADMGVVIQPAHLHVVGDIAKDQILARSVPGWPFGPKCARVKAPNRCIPDGVLLEALIERDDVRIGVTDRFFTGPITLLLSGGQRSEGSCC